MNEKNYNSAIALLIQLIVKNNPGGVARALSKVGYEAKGFIPAVDLENALLQLHMGDQDAFFQVMKDIPWNYGDMATNKPEIRDQLIALTGSVDNATAKGEWWTVLLSLVQTVVTPPNAGPAPETNTTGIYVLAAVAVVIIIILILILVS